MGNYSCKIINFTWNSILKLFTLVLVVMFGTVQVEVPGPRGRPSTIVDKDDDLGKVKCCTDVILICVLWLF